MFDSSNYYIIMKNRVKLNCSRGNQIDFLKSVFIAADNLKYST